MQSDSNIRSCNRTALVTGATGFIGSHLVGLLKDRGYRVHIYSRQSFDQKHQGLVIERDWFEGELADKDKLRSACEGVDVVFHAAGLADSGIEDLEKMTEVNLLGTKSVFSAAALAGVERFIFFSSILAEESLNSAYATSKRSVEQFLTSFQGESSRVVPIILRPANVYGPGMRGNLLTLIKLVRSGVLPSLPQFNGRFSLVSVHDLCRAAIMANEDVSLGSSHQIYTVTDGQVYSLNRIESAVYKHLNQENPRFKLPKAAIHVVASIAKLLNFLGLKRNQVGLRLLENLYEDRPTDKSNRAPIFDFTPTATIESEMAKIISALD